MTHLFGEHVNTDWIFLGLCPEFNLSQDLVGEGVTHDKRRMSHGTAKVYKTSLSKEDDMATIGKLKAVNLRLHFYTISQQPKDYFIVINL